MPSKARLLAVACSVVQLSRDRFKDGVDTGRTHLVVLRCFKKLAQRANALTGLINLFLDLVLALCRHVHLLNTVCTYSIWAVTHCAQDISRHLLSPLSARSRPRLARPLNRSLLLTLPTKVYAMRGAALRSILDVLWLTGFDGFCLYLRVLDG